jgi:hypothetical protein
MQEAGYENFDRVSLKIRGQDEPGVRLEKRYYARGSSRSDAMENAKMIAYNVVRNDSILTFDSNFSFRPGASFRGQSLDMTLYIPYNEPFKMSDDLRYILRSTIYSSGYSTSDMEGNTWMFTRESGLKCTSCPAVKSEEHHETGIFDMSGYNREIPVHSFSSINADGLFKINVVKDSETKTVINGRSEDIDNIMVKNEGDELDINYKNKLTHWDRNRDEITINISVPSLDHVKFSGATKATLKGFDTDHMEMELSGASTAEADLDVRTLRVKIDGASNLTLNGEGENLILSVEGASGVDAFEYEVKNGDLKVSGASSARVNVTENLDANTSGFGKIRYKGEPNEVNVHGSGSGISKED